MAFRMGQDLGFHRDPRHWMSKDRSILTRADFEIRRRIYWGCYLADKYMSLFMGRPVCLIERDAEVKPVEPLPDFPENHTWFGLTKLAADISQPTGSRRPQLTKGLRYMVSLGEIFQNIIGVLFAPKGQSTSQTDRASVLNHLDQFNLHLNRWLASLPESLQWSQWSQPKDRVGTNVLAIHLFYHSVVLSLNRHFIGQAPAQIQTTPQRFEQSQTACAISCGAVIAIARQFRKQPAGGSPPILLIYALVTVAITVAAASGREGGRNDSRVHYIVKDLAQYSRQYKLAGEMRWRLARYFRLAPFASTSPGKDDTALTANINEPLVSDAAEVPMSGLDDRIPGVDESGSSAIDGILESINYDDIWSGGFQDWFLLQNVNGF